MAVCGNRITSKRPSAGRCWASLKTAYLAIWGMLAKSKLSIFSRVPSACWMRKGRNCAKVRTTDTISLRAPLLPFSMSMATTGVSPNPM